MKSNYLLSNKFKIPGWILLIIGLTAYVFLFFYDSPNIMEVNVLSIYDGASFSNDKITYFKIIENNIADELIALSIIIGGLCVGFSKEKVEDEFIYKLRTDSLVWAVILNYGILMFTVIFIYNFKFFDVLMYNMFTPLLFFIIRFNFLKSRA
ncbi:hypothetical protein ES692_15260 [Psychroserpens burtonensis]|uniref:Uncharacterized protein n=1 Tax=Psychroserpens burtonensis TaxID=49278 RepID=A0A5C7BCN5_9FLAO|nr:hypothetical protein [Psychroserpens burtonensis]TXE15737.1 hypothetical protein ES692_15260 [Psychroserpens burtonensis]